MNIPNPIPAAVRFLQNFPGMCKTVANNIVNSFQNNLAQSWSYIGPLVIGTCWGGYFFKAVLLDATLPIHAITRMTIDGVSSGVTFGAAFNSLIQINRIGQEAGKPVVS